MWEHVISITSFVTDLHFVLRNPQKRITALVAMLPWLSTVGVLNIFSNFMCGVVIWILLHPHLLFFFACFSFLPSPLTHLLSQKNCDTHNITSPFRPISSIYTTLILTVSKCGNFQASVYRRINSNSNSNSLFHWNNREHEGDRAAIDLISVKLLSVISWRAVLLLYWMTSYVFLENVTLIKLVKSH